MNSVKEKEKGKHNPFAKVLAPDEEIVWFYVSHFPSLKWPQQFIQFFRLYLPPVMLFSLLPLALTAAIPSALHALWCLSTEVVVAVTVIPLVLAHHQHGQQQRIHTATEIYAITNKRLLMSVLNNVLSLALEDIQSVELQTGEGGASILLSHEVFPDWHHIEDAQTARELIAQARDYRLKALSNHQLL